MAQITQPIRVFLSDDSTMIRDRVAAILASHAIDVVGEAATPAASVASILAAQPDVVVLDVQLEGGTGLDVLRAVRRANPAIAFVIFSINAGAPFRQRYLAEGATRFLDKAIEFDQLASAVQEAAAAAR